MPFRLLLLVLALSLAALPVRAQPGGATSVVTGIVRDTLGRPLAAAEVRIGDLSDFSDAEGRFRVEGVKPDTLDLIVRRIGYVPASVLIAIDAGVTVELAVTLVPLVVELGTIVVEGRTLDRRLWREGFYARQRAGHGTFLGPEQLERFRGQPLSSLVRRAPAVTVQRGRAGKAIALGKFGASPCALNVILDGQLIRWASTTGLDEVVNRGDIHAMEIYPRYQNIPAALAMLVGVGTQPTDCGALVIWTKPLGETPVEVDHR